MGPSYIVLTIANIGFFYSQPNYPVQILQIIQYK